MNVTGRGRSSLGGSAGRRYDPRSFTPEVRLLLSSTRNLRALLLGSAVSALAASGASCTAPKDGGTARGARGAEKVPWSPPAEPALRADWQARAAAYLDRRAASWLASPPPIANVKCAMSCHTTFPYVVARSALAPFARTPAADEARARLEARVAEAAAGTAIPFYGKDGDARVRQSHATEAVLNAAALALDDLGSRRPLAASTRTALERMWAQQRADGAWDWLDFGLEPWESHDDFGAALAALVAGSIPAGTTRGQAAGTARLVEYFRGRAGHMGLHDRAWLLWASGRFPGLVERRRARDIAEDLRATQDQYGGTFLGGWGRTPLARDAEHEWEGDGYATAITVLALCSGMLRDSQGDKVTWGLRWLAGHQAEDGSWPGRSVNAKNALADQFMTDAATAYAVLAITTCAPGPAASR